MCLNCQAPTDEMDDVTTEFQGKDCGTGIFPLSSSEGSKCDRYTEKHKKQEKKKTDKKKHDSQSSHLPPHYPEVSW